MRSLSRFTLLHLLANALLLALGYYWLGIRESQTTTLLGSALLALALAAFVSCTYGAPFAFFQTEKQRGAIDAWSFALRRMFPFTVAACVALAIYWILARAHDAGSQPAFQIASYLTLKLRRPVRPVSIMRMVDGLIWLVRWAILPVLLLPMFSAIVERGWSGFRSIGTRARHWIYWIEVPALLLCVIWIPRKLLGWVPLTEGFGWEMASFVMRAAVAYLFFCGAWLILAFVTSAGKPRLNQSSTEVSP